MPPNTVITFIGGVKRVNICSPIVVGRYLTANTSGWRGQAGQKLAYIGDSLTYQDGNGEVDIPNSLNAVGWPLAGIYFYSWPGKQIADPDAGGNTTMWNIQQARAAIGEPDLWVIALCTNDNSDSYDKIADDMQTVFAELGVDARLMWVNEGTANNNNQEEVNNVIATQLSGRPHSYLADWYTYVNSIEQTGIWTDGTHMTSKGWAIRNSFIADETLNAMMVS